MNRLRITSVFLFLLFVCQLIGQKEITGLVTNEQNEPLIGVTIVVKDFSDGTTTDIDGKYTLSIPASARFLVYSYIGFATREVEISLSDTIDIVLRAKASFLDEIIVTGVPLGTPTTKVGFNISKVNADQLSEVPGVNAASVLQSKVPGVQILAPVGTPGSSPDILIRGASSILGLRSPPLIIVDGIQLQESANLSDINSEDIANVEVIKGAAATSLYGSRAGGGVISITTKRGASQGNQTQITFRNELGSSSVVRLLARNTHHPYVLNPDGSVDYSKPDDDLIADNDYPEVFDHQSLFFDPGMHMINSLSIGSKKQETNYFLSLNNTRQEGTLIHIDGYSRQSIRANIDHKIYDFLKLSFSNYYAQSSSDEPLGANTNSAFFDLGMMPPGIDLTQPNEEDGSPYNFNAAREANSPFTNPLYYLFNDVNELKTERYTGSMGLNITINPFLSLDGIYSLDRRSISEEAFRDKGFLVWPFQYDGWYRRGNRKRTYQTANAKISFKKAFEHFTVASQAAFIYEDDKSRFFEVEAFDFRFAGIRSLSNSGNSEFGGTNRTQRRSSDFDVNTINYYLTGSIDWKEKLIIDGLIRFDGSSLFGSNNRWNTFYRTSLAYRLTQDIDIPQVQELKLRASYGTAGIRPQFDYRFETLNSDGTKGFLGNEDLRSAVKKEVELGFDARIWNRVNLNFSYAQSFTVDVFSNEPLPVTAGGFQFQWQNVDSELKSISWEASLGIDVVRKEEFTLSADLVFNRLRQILNKYHRPELVLGSYIFKEGLPLWSYSADKFARSEEDLFPHQLEGKSYVVNEEGWLVEADKLGTVDERPILVEEENGNRRFTFGTATPDFELGFGLNTRWKRWQLYSQFHWRNGGQIYNRTKQITFDAWVHGDFDQSQKSVSQRKPTTYYHAFFNQLRTTNYFLEDGSYLKLRELAISFDFNTENWGKTSTVLKGLKISLIGRNLFTITNYTGYDPEVAWPLYRFQEEQQPFDANLLQIDQFGYPNFRTISGSIEFRF